MIRSSTAAGAAPPSAVRGALGGLFLALLLSACGDLPAEDTSLKLTAADEVLSHARTKETKKPEGATAGRSSEKRAVIQSTPQSRQDAAPTSVAARPNDEAGDLLLELTECCAEQTLSQLQLALLDPDAGVRQSAADALADIPASDALALLGQALADKHVAVREAAVEALAAHADPRADAWLLLALGDPDAEIRELAAELLQQTRANHLR